jgi:hypothetical protein
MKSNCELSLKLKGNKTGELLMTAPNIKDIWNLLQDPDYLPFWSSNAFVCMYACRYVNPCLFSHLNSFPLKALSSLVQSWKLVT